MFVSDLASVVLDYKQFKAVHCVEANGMFETFLEKRQGASHLPCANSESFKVCRICIHMKPQGLLFTFSTAWLNLFFDVSITDIGWSSEGSSFVLWPEWIGIFIVILFICLFLSLDTESR